MATGIKDIAKELGVSLATVSRALADSPDISAETKERVWATAEALNYLPNLMARSLRSRRTRVIGVVVQEVASEFGAHAIRGIHDELNRCGYQMLLSSGSTSAEQERTAVSTLLERSVDGLIVADAFHHLVDALPAELESGRLPVVFVNRRSKSSTAASFVGPDDVFGGYLATEHLIGHGHRRIAYLSGPVEWQASWDRLDGYRRALADYGLPRAHYYHPQRGAGTLRCHYRHRAHDDPFAWPGLTDITSWVDFTAVAEAAAAAGLDVAGYATQAHFLLDAGLQEELAGGDSPVPPRLAQQAKTLLLPGEMGERFKIMALGRGEVAVGGFRFRDLRHAL